MSNLILLHRSNCPTQTAELIVLFRIGISRFHFVTGSQHGQTGDHAVHIEAVWRADPRLRAWLGQMSRLLECQGDKTRTWGVQVLVYTALRMDTVKAAHHIAVEHVHHGFSHRFVNTLMREHTLLNDDVTDGLPIFDHVHLVP